MTACAHCGEAVRATAPAGPAAAERFCCAGCATAWATLHAAGVADYYRLRNSLPPTARVEPSADDLAALADPALTARLIPDPERPEVQLHLSGLHCGSCAWVVEELALQLPGVEAVRVRLPAERAIVRLDPAAPAGPVLRQLLRTLADAGYRATPLPPGTSGGSTSGGTGDVLRLGISAALGLNIMLMAVSLYGGDEFGMEQRFQALFRWISLGLATPLVLYGGAPFLRRAVAGLRVGVVHVDLPLAVALVLVYAASAVATFRGAGEVWFDSLAMLIVLLLGGRLLEGRVRGGVSARLEALLVARDPRVRRIASFGSELVAARAVVSGDRIELLPGDVLPVDVVVLQGTSDVDLSVTDGESRPRDARPGTTLPAGTRLLTGRVVAEVRGGAEEAWTARIRERIDIALGQKTPTEHLADRFARGFVVAILGIGGATYLLWRALAPERALEATVAVLIAACPCALALGTPLAFAAAVHAAASRGLLVRSGEAIRTLADVDRVIFDKTGTLSLPEPVAVAFRASDPTQTDAVLRLAAGACQASHHPVARAVVRVARHHLPAARFPFATDVRETPGVGLDALVEGHRVQVRGPGVQVRIDGHLAADADLVDLPRPSAAIVIEALHARGIATSLLSGDQPERVEAFADLLDIPSWGAAASPVEKVHAVRAWQAQGERIALVGDGLNDAAALAEADVGIALGAGAELSLEAADAAIVPDGLQPVSDCIDLGRRLRRVLRQNVALSLTYNTLAVSAAAAGLITPLVAAALMPFSSVVVVLSAARLIRS